MNGHYNVGDTVLDNWTLTRLLGQDSAGCVFEAVQNDSGLMNKAAFKILTIPKSLNDIMNIMADGMDKDGAIEYFKGSIGDLLEEFLLMTKLQGYPNIVHYDEHQVLQHTEGIGWDILLRMELLTPLISYAQSRQLERENIIRLGIDICQALEYCKEFSIVHGDIKPGNIFLSNEGEFMLGDFGIARTLDKTSNEFSKNAYTAPELYRGEPYRHSSDIYSLGVVLYWLLNNNRTPFMPLAPTPITHSARELALIRQLQGDPFAKPVNADDALAKVVLRACAFDSRKRYASPAMLREDLEAILSGKEISAVSAASLEPEDSAQYDDYETGGLGEDFYDIIKSKSSQTENISDDSDYSGYSDSDTDYSQYDDRRDLDEQESYQQEKTTRPINFDDELYDDDRKESFIATAITFVKHNLAMVSLVAAAALVVIIAILILVPFGEAEPPDPDPDLEEEAPPPVQIETVPVPDVTGLTQIQLAQNDQWVSVFAFNIIGEDFSDTVPEGAIISQTPEANSRHEVSPLGERIRVNLIISLGPEPHPLDGVESVEIRWGVNPLPGRANNNPGLTLRLVTDPEIILTARILPLEFDFEQFTEEELMQYIEWESSNEDIFKITAENMSDFSVRIEARGTGNASLIVRVGELEDRVTVTVAN